MVRILSLFLLLASAAAAADVKKPRAHSIQASILGAFLLNYEYRPAASIGLLAEGFFFFGRVPEIESNSFGGSVQTRWYWFSQVDSPFLGVFGKYVGSQMNAEAGIVTSFAVGANIGKRWLWSNGFSMTMRLGYGYAMLDLDTVPRSLLTTSTREGKEDLLRVMAGVDFEWSFGFSF